MKDFAFKVNLVALVRVRAADESVARKVVPTVLGAPSTVEIGLANENNAATGRHATITDVDFSIGSVKPFWGQGSELAAHGALTFRPPSRSTRRFIFGSSAFSKPGPPLVRGAVKEMAQAGLSLAEQLLE